MKRLTHAVKKVAAKAAKSIVKTNANATCVFVAHQEKMPASAKKLRKF